jgi:serine phosphatase RsbU (regulator of sigma subunit)
MSIIGNALLNQTLSKHDNWSPAQSLDMLDAELKKSLNRNSEDRPLRDGMDIAFCCIDMQGKKLEYAGANNPIYIVRNKELILLEADKQPITASRESPARPFTNKPFDLVTGDCVYLFTDGYADQFGGEKGKKFLYKRFKETFVEISDKPMQEQKSLLYHTFMNWKGNLPQVDDTLVIGIRIQ